MPSCATPGELSLSMANHHKSREVTLGEHAPLPVSSGGVVEWGSAIPGEAESSPASPSLVRLSHGGTWPDSVS